MSPWTIEPLLSAAELDGVLAVEESSFTNPWTREMYLAEFDHPDVSSLYVARDAGGRIIGFCSFWRILDEVHINNLAVAPPFRRAGVASALLTTVLQDGARVGAEQTTLEVRRSNAEALQLYERFGFTVAAVRAGYYTHPTEDALVLWRDGARGRRP